MPRSRRGASAKSGWTPAREAAYDRIFGSKPLSEETTQTIINVVKAVERDSKSVSAEDRSEQSTVRSSGEVRTVAF